MFRAELKSIRTTVVAVLAFLLVLLTAILYCIDMDPSTVADWNKVADALALLLISVGFFSTRDARKTSEESGLKK